MNLVTLFFGKRLGGNAANAPVQTDLQPQSTTPTRTQEELERDLAECRRSENELRQALQKLERRLSESNADLDLANDRMQQLAAIVESSEDAIIGCTLNGVVTIWNQGAERLFGYSAEEVIGEPTSTNARLNWPDEIKAMKRVRNGEHVAPLETIRTRKDGKQIHVSVSVSPIREGGGRIIGASLICRDISARKELEGQIQQAQKMEAIGQLAGGIAHDFNNLLTVVMGYSECLVDDLAERTQSQQMAQEILRAAGRAADLTKQLLAFGRKAIIAPTVLDLNGEIHQTESMLRRLIGEDIELVIATVPKALKIRIDPGQLHQVILNLSVNARDAMPHGGQLRIETSSEILEESTIRGRPRLRPGRHAVLTVTDTGCGISPEIAAHIFEPFFTTKETGKGTGLGLATAYGIIEQAGGHIEVESRPGQGALFRIHLPQVAGSEHDARTEPRGKRCQGNETVLLVEDESMVRAYAGHILRESGYHVLEARDGSEALQLCRQHSGPLHLLVTDVVLPRDNGREVAEQTATLRPGIKVLYLSGYTEDTVLRHGVIEAEMQFLAKPFAPSALVSKVREVLDTPT